MKVTTVYYKPLVAGLPSGVVDPDKVLKRLSREILRRMKSHIVQTTFSDRAKRSLAKALKVEIKANSLVVQALHPAFLPLIEGQRKKQMTWLTKAKRPIPIVTEDGELIFRNATPHSMANGHWVHPGRKPQDFIEKAKADARSYLKAQLAKEFKRQIKATWMKR